ncbi:MAG: pyruvate carboxyltransferase [Syntrophothermus sp.]|uniref:LeuA family protein n=1 Tax=Syntrophothermus sp. TaxID=2736299 RepID=UPI002580238B|nr:pyruvate carboxyltransferase [Syntrophothermus sp.]NSW83581.1 pyruvate carboxyltransferase [Syntrophothermus sp.]
MSTPWKTDKWFTSPWNYFEDVIAGLEFPKNIQLHDVSLRDGEQQAGLIFSAEEKVRIAEALAEVGVHRIEAGMPAVSKEDERAIKEIVKRNLGPKIFAFARCMVDDIKRAVDCGVDGVVVEIPSSEHMIEHAYKWTLSKAIDLSVKATNYAKECNLYTVFFPIDATRADINWCLDLLNKVAEEGHMDALAVVDTFGGLSPNAVGTVIRKIKRHINKPIEVHFHDDFGLAAANTVLALAAGAEVAHTTITGIGERAGNAAYEDVAMTLLTMYNIDLGLKYDKIYETSKLLREISGIQVPQNRAIVGDMIYKIESGIIASWYRNCGRELPLELFPMRWDLMGHKAPEIVLGKNSGTDSVLHWLEKLGLSATDEQVNELVQAVKDEAYIKHRLLTPEEFEALARRILEQGK